jgi:hypothetical protein
MRSGRSRQEILPAPGSVAALLRKCGVASGEGLKRLPYYLVHVTAAVGGEPADNTDLCPGLRERLTALVEHLVSAGGSGSVGIARPAASRRRHEEKSLVSDVMVYDHVPSAA